MKFWKYLFYGLGILNWVILTIPLTFFTYCWVMLGKRPTMITTRISALPLYVYLRPMAGASIFFWLMSIWIWLLIMALFVIFIASDKGFTFKEGRGGWKSIKFSMISFLFVFVLMIFSAAWLID